MLTLSHLVRFLVDAARQIVVVGIQPACVGDGEWLSAEIVEIGV